MDRTANLLAAASVRIADLVHASTAFAAGRGAQAPAALVALARPDERAIEELRQLVGLSHSATVRLVDRLERDGLVERSAGRDGRTVTPTLTAAGRLTASAVQRARARAVEPLLAALEPAERAQLAHLLERLLAVSAIDHEAGVHACRLCDVDACYHGGSCPVDDALGETRPGSEPQESL